MKPINECNTVYELLEDPKRWCKKVFSTNGFDLNSGDCILTDPCNPKSFSWCVQGAMLVIQAKTGRKFEEMNDKLKNVVKSCTFIWNDKDERTHEEVLAAVKEAGI